MRGRAAKITLVRICSEPKNKGAGLWVQAGVLGSHPGLLGWPCPGRGTLGWLDGEILGSPDPEPGRGPACRNGLGSEGKLRQGLAVGRARWGRWLWSWQEVRGLRLVVWLVPVFPGCGFSLMFPLTQRSGKPLALPRVFALGVQSAKRV